MLLLVEINLIIKKQIDKKNSFIIYIIDYIEIIFSIISKSINTFYI